MLEKLRTKKGGICSICSANEFVIRAAFRNKKANQGKVLIESTSNQVDQFGGYTGMTPADFTAYIRRIAGEEEFPPDNCILGGDHLGPNSWQDEPADRAMEKACDLISAYVKAGYTKIHLDTSMHCAGDSGDKNSLLDFDLVAKRAAELCFTAEQFAGTENPPVYIIGTDVPIPGGAQEYLDDIRITPVVEVSETIEITRRAFFQRGLQAAWERVIAVVVQPGVEFGDERVIHYDREKTKELVDFISKTDNMVYEAHSTDYQTGKALRQMVEDHFAILKVGPWLTFALRETLFSLANIEKELFADKKNTAVSNLMETVERRMLENPKYWQAHYHGNEEEQRLARKYSYSDRIRYYWPDPVISESLDCLIQNLRSTSIPLTLVSQYLPAQYLAIREHRIQNRLDELIDLGITSVLNTYDYAVGETVN